MDYYYTEKRDISDNEEQQLKNKKSKGKNIIILALSIVVLSVTLSFFTLNKSMKDLEGVWVRQPDDNSLAYGMKVEIKQDGPMYVGEVIAIDDVSACPIGSIKWNNFKKSGLDAFGYHDMTLSYNPTDRHYSSAYALISANGKTLKIYAPFATSGTYQIWYKE